MKMDIILLPKRWQSSLYTKNSSRTQQHPPLLLRPAPSSLNTASHSLIPPAQPPVAALPLPPFRLLLPRPPSSLTAVPPLFTLRPSSPLQLASPYWIPLAGSSGSISPSSILVSIMLARRENSSSTPAPLYAETSTETGILLLEAHCDTVETGLSRPSGATVTV